MSVCLSTARHQHLHRTAILHSRTRLPRQLPPSTSHPRRPSERLAHIGNTTLTDLESSNRRVSSSSLCKRRRHQGQIASPFSRTSVTTTSHFRQVPHLRCLDSPSQQRLNVRDATHPSTSPNRSSVLLPSHTTRRVSPVSCATNDSIPPFL